MFTRATKRRARGRIHLTGPSGSGKTRSALEIGRHLGPRIALIDTERGSASKYADLVEFDVCEIADNYHPDKLTAALREAGAAYDVVIVDSFTHFWKGIGGFLELVDAEVARQRQRGGSADSFGAWKAVDPVYRRTIDAILSCPAHVIVTTRAKQDHVVEKDDKGKTRIRKVGLASEAREGLEYEVDVDGMLDLDHRLVIGKTRCPALDGGVFDKPGADVARILLAWLEEGAPAPEPARRALPLMRNWLAEITAADVVALDAIAADLANEPDVVRAKYREVYAARRAALRSPS